MSAVTVTISGPSDAGCGVLATEIELYLKTLGLKAQWADNPHPHPLTMDERAQALVHHRPHVTIVKDTHEPKARQRMYAQIASLRSAEREDRPERGLKILQRIAADEVPGVDYASFLTLCRDKGLQKFVAECHRWYEKKS